MNSRLLGTNNKLFLRRMNLFFSENSSFEQKQNKNFVQQVGWKRLSCHVVVVVLESFIFHFVWERSFYFARSYYRRENKRNRSSEKKKVRSHERMVRTVSSSSFCRSPEVRIKKENKESPPNVFGNRYTQNM